MTKNAPPPRLIDSDALLPAMAPALLVEAIRAGHLEAPLITGRDVLEAGAVVPPQRYIELAAWRPGRALGSKLATIFPGNEQLGHGPVIQSVFVLFDGRTGALRGLITGESFTRYKTAADSALGASLLARKNARVLTVIGAGAQAEAHIRVLSATLPSIEQVHVYNRTHAKAQQLARRLGCGQVRVTATTNVERAVRAADVLACLTAATAPVFAGEWLQPGVHVDLVGAYTPQMRECDDATVRTARVFVNNYELALASGDLHIPLEQGVITHAAIRGDLYALCQERVAGRRSDADITLYKNAGGGHIDLMVAECLYQQHRRRASKV